MKALDLPKIVVLAHLRDEVGAGRLSRAAARLIWEKAFSGQRSAVSQGGVR